MMGDMTAWIANNSVQGDDLKVVLSMIAIFALAVLLARLISGGRQGPHDRASGDW
jgi:hypothetical protein